MQLSILVGCLLSIALTLQTFHDSTVKTSKGDNSLKFVFWIISYWTAPMHAKRYVFVSRLSWQNNVDNKTKRQSTFDIVPQKETIYTLFIGIHYVTEQVTTPTGNKSSYWCFSLTIFIPEILQSKAEGKNMCVSVQGWMSYKGSVISLNAFNQKSRSVFPYSFQWNEVHNERYSLNSAETWDFLLMI